MSGHFPSSQYLISVFLVAVTPAIFLLEGLFGKEETHVEVREVEELLLM